MTNQTAKIKDGIISIPKALRKSWNGAEVFMRSSDDTIVIKKLQKAPFWETWKRLGKDDNKISRKEINAAIKWARSQ